MRTLQQFLNGLSVAEQEAFAARCGTTIGYLRKQLSSGGRFGESLAIALDRESGGAVTVEHLRPDVDWAYLRGRAGEQSEAAA